jgi:hypothetical protein
MKKYIVTLTGKVIVIICSCLMVIVLLFIGSCDMQKAYGGPYLSTTLTCDNVARSTFVLDCIKNASNSSLYSEDDINLDELVDSCSQISLPLYCTSSPVFYYNHNFDNTVAKPCSEAKTSDEKFICGK